MSTSDYEQIRDRFGNLPAEEQDQLLRELGEQAAKRRAEKGSRSILELCGMGKEIWQGVDASEYVRRERAAWDG